MTYTRLFELVTKVARRAAKSGGFIVLALVAAFSLLAIEPAHAQNGDTWKSVAIIGGSTAAGAIVGHQIAGRTGTLIGAGVGATAGYAIDRHRRQNEYNNQYGYYGGGGPYYPSNGGYYGNGPYYGGPYGGGYPAGYYRSRR